MRTCKECACNHICNITHTDNCPACIDYKAEAITELKKIICELRNCYPSMPIFNKRKWQEENKAYLDCESIILNHITELESENI